MFTSEAVMYDDSNLNKNEFTGIVSFAVNFHFFHAQLMLRGHLFCSLAVSLPCLSSGGRKGETESEKK